MKQKIILASESKIRRKLLLQAEVNFQSIAAKIDEDTIKESLKNEGAKPKDISDALAEYKAIRVANNFPTDIIIGCDQILVCNNEIISKARTLNEAKETLKLLRGKSHQLLSSVIFNFATKSQDLSIHLMHKIIDSHHFAFLLFLLVVFSHFPRSFVHLPLNCR